MEKIHSKTKVAIRIIVTALLVFALIPFGAMTAFAAGTDNGDGTYTVTERIEFPETIGSAVFTADGGETVTITAATGYDSDDVETTSLSFGGNAVNNSFGDGTEYAIVTMIVSGVTGQFTVTATGDGTPLGSWTYGQDPPPDPVFTFSATPTTVELDADVQSGTVTVTSTKDGADADWSAVESFDWLDAATIGNELTLSFVGDPNDGDKTGTVTLVQTESGKELAIIVNYTAPIIPPAPVYVFDVDEDEVALSKETTSYDVAVTSTKDNVNLGWNVSETLGWLEANINDDVLTLSLVGLPADDQSGVVTLAQVESGEDLTITVNYTAPVVPEPITYEVIKHFGEWVLGTSDGLTARIAANRDSFLRLTLNGALLEAGNNYTVAGDDETVITLTNGLLNNLLVGEHQLVAWYSDGYSEAINLTVKAASVPVPVAAETNLPQTGDGNVVGLATAAMLAIIAGFALVMTSQKRRHHNS